MTQTIQHSSTLPPPPPPLPPQPLDVSNVEGVEPQVYQFEQVSSDDHQMSVGGEAVGTQVPYPEG